MTLPKTALDEPVEYLKDRQGKILSVGEFIELYMDPEYIVLGADILLIGEDEVRVSTVWFGIDHGDGCVFETAICPSSAPTETVRRYSTEAEAIAGHQEYVNEFRKQLGYD